MGAEQLESKLDKLEVLRKRFSEVVERIREWQTDYPEIGDDFDLDEIGAVFELALTEDEKFLGQREEVISDILKQLANAAFKFSADRVEHKTIHDAETSGGVELLKLEVTHLSWHELYSNILAYVLGIDYFMPKSTHPNARQMRIAK